MFPGKTAKEEFSYFDYCDTEGRRLFTTLRFEFTDGTKQVLPAVVGRKKTTGRLNWHPKWPPAPRVLYPLPTLVTYSDRTVLVLEGELKTEAANELAGFEYVAVSYSAGAQRAQPRKNRFGH